MAELDKEMRAHFGIRPGMTKEQRVIQLASFTPASEVTDADWAAWRAVKS